MIALLAAAVLFTGLGRGRIVTPHEARVADTALTMAQSGMPWSAAPVKFQSRQVNPWLIPVFQGSIRLKKPPLPYWCTAAAFMVLGAGPGSARLPTALLGIGAAALVYCLARDLAGRRTAFWAALAWVSTFFIADEFRKTMADPYLAFFSLGALAAWVRLSQRAADHRRHVWTAIFYGAIAFGLLAKGPVLLLHLVIPIALHGLLYRRWPRLGLSAHALGMATVLLIALPWPVYVLRHIPDALEIWRFESVGEFSDNVRNARPWWFYIPSLFQLSLPWTPVWVLAIYLSLRRKRRELAFAAGWCAAIVLIFSFVHMKKNAYLLPLMPAQCLLVGRALALLCAGARLKAPRQWSKWILDAQVLLGIGFALGIAAMVIVGPVETGRRRTASAPSRPSIAQVKERIAGPAGAAAGVCVVAGLLPMLRAVSRRMERRILVQAAVYSILIVFTLVFIEAEKANRREPSMSFAAGTINRSPTANPQFRTIFILHSCRFNQLAEE